MVSPLTLPSLSHRLCPPSPERTGPEIDGGVHGRRLTSTPKLPEAVRVSEESV